MIDLWLGFHPMYTHIKFYGTDIVPPDQIGGVLDIYWLRVLPRLILAPPGQVIEGLKHFTVSDVKFHPKMYVVGVLYFPLSNMF